MVQATCTDRLAAVAALTGATVLFTVSAEESPERVAVHRGLTDAAVGAGVQHVVHLPSVTAAPDSTFTLGLDHWQTEEALRATGSGRTFLRDDVYADFLPPLVGVDGVIEEAHPSRARTGAPTWQVEAWVSSCTGIARGDVATVTSDVEVLTGHPPMTLGQLLGAAH